MAISHSHPFVGELIERLGLDPHDLQKFVLTVERGKPVVLEVERHPVPKPVEDPPVQKTRFTLQPAA